MEDYDCITPNYKVVYLKLPKYINQVLCISNISVNFDSVIFFMYR